MAKKEEPRYCKHQFTHTGGVLPYLYCKKCGKTKDEILNREAVLGLLEK